MQSFLGRRDYGKGRAGHQRGGKWCVKILAHKWFVNMTAGGLVCKTPCRGAGQPALALLADEWQVHGFDLQGKLPG
jgi:hypothetical protein